MGKNDFKIENQHLINNNLNAKNGTAFQSFMYFMNYFFAMRSATFEEEKKQNKTKLTMQFLKGKLG